MLQEERNIRQAPGDLARRWWADDYFDLIVWFETSGSVWGFQLCYDRHYSPRALTWTRAKGYSHAAIDNGEGEGGMHKESPILVPDGLFDFKSTGDRLAAAAGDLPPEIKALVLEKVYGFSRI